MSHLERALVTNIGYREGWVTCSGVTVALEGYLIHSMDFAQVSVYHAVDHHHVRMCLREPVEFPFKKIMSAHSTVMRTFQDASAIFVCRTQTISRLFYNTIPVFE